MKTTFRIPTKDTYAYVEFEVDIDPEEAKVFYDQKFEEFNSNSTGLETKEWNEVLDDYLHRDKISVDTYEKMSDRQKAFIQEIKKSKNRQK